MISFLAPAFLQVALAVAAGAVALHFLVRRQPPSRALPTARFVPEGAVETVTVTRRPQDLLTLLLRVLLVLLVGAAFARPIFHGARQPVVRIVAADVSRAVASAGELRDSVGALLGEHDVLVAFDSAARVVSTGAADSARRLDLTDAPARLTPTLLVALRTAAGIRERADSIELVIVSPLVSGATDRATAELRALWPGRIRLVELSAAGVAEEARDGVSVTADADDVLRLAVVAAGLSAGEAGVRVARSMETADTGLASQPGRTLVRWPASGAAPGWVALPSPDTVGAVVAMQGVAGIPLVAPLERRWRLADEAAPARVVARWVDGAPAAVERIVGGGCIRDVMVDVPARGDLVLRPQFARFLAALTRPCDALAPPARLPDAERLMLAGAGPLAATARIASPDEVATPLVAWLLGAALLVALLEQLARRGATQSHDGTWAASGDGIAHATDLRGTTGEPERAA